MHLRIEPGAKAAATPPEWLRTGAQIGTLVNIWADRGDVVAYVGPGAGGPAPACFIPNSAEVEVNVAVAFGEEITPDEINDFTQRSTQFEWPKAAGALFHEAMHARFSRWSIPDAMKAIEDAGLPESVFQAIQLLEESRIEKLGVETHPENAPFLRSCALEIVLSDVSSESIMLHPSVSSFAQLAGLTLARVDADVLRESDVELVRDVLAATLGDDALDSLREVWVEFQALRDHRSFTKMIPLGKRWVEIVDELKREHGETDETDGAESGSAGGAPAGSGAETESSDGDTGAPTREGSGSLAEKLKELVEAIEDAAEEAEIGAADDAADQEITEEWEREVAERASDAERARDHKSIATRVFSKGTGPGSGGTRSMLVKERPPSGSERAAAVVVSRMLEKARYRDRTVTDTASVLPPGRLRSRAMVQAAALKSKGVAVDVEPWRRRQRRHTDSPELTVGTLVDISGSMGGAMEPMAVVAWVLSEAVRRAQGRTAMVYYGTSVFPTLKPGEHLKDVKIYSAPDATEKFTTAFKAIDGALGLIGGRGARLLVIVSDCCYTHEEQQALERYVTACIADGVGVLVIPFDGGWYASGAEKAGAVVLTKLSKSADLAVAIGKAAATALERAGGSR